MGERAQNAYAAAEQAAFAALPRRRRLLANLCAAALVALLALFLALVFVGPIFAETVDVKYRGPVDLANFECTGELDSSLVKRVCYNADKAYMLIRLKNTWYHYCEIDRATVDALLAADSLGRYYNASIKDSGTGGKFGCRDKVPPQF
jgi:hypothetical protein